MEVRSAPDGKEDDSSFESKVADDVFDLDLVPLSDEDSSNSDGCNQHKELPRKPLSPKVSNVQKPSLLKRSGSLLKRSGSFLRNKSTSSIKSKSGSRSSLRLKST